MSKPKSGSLELAIDIGLDESTLFYKKTEMDAYIIELETERDELRAWKTEAMAVAATWDVQRVGRLLGLALGQNIYKNIEPKIEELLEQNQNK